MRIILTLVCIISLNFSIFAQDELSLKEAVTIALHKNTQLLKTSNELQGYESDVKASYGNFLPDLNASGSFGWTRTEVQARTISYGGFVLQQPATTSETRSYSANLNSGITIFDGLSNIAQLNQSKNNLEAARLNLERVKQDIVFQTISLYYQVINAQQQLKVKEEDVKYNQKNLETITERNKLGGATLADVYLQQVQAGNADLALIQAKNSLETAKSNLLYYLGLNVFQEYTYSDTLTSSESQLLKSNIDYNYADLANIAEQALNSRVDYKSAKLSLESAYNGVTIAQSGHLPVLSGNGSFGLGSNKINELWNSKTYSLGLNLSIPIFSGFSVSNRVQLAEVNAEDHQYDLSDLERQIKKDIQKTYLDLQAAEKALGVSKNNVKSAQENLKIEQEKYSLGSGKLLDVLVANTNYTTAQSDYINSEFSYIVLSQQLKYYLGTLEYKQYE
ncbi:MAG: TolC family protein [Ignavibacteriaceae bacterium]